MEVVQGVKKKLFAPLYDSQRHATTGHTELPFFLEAIGQGTSAHVGSGSKKLVDTNLRQGGRLSAGQRASVIGIRVKFKQTDYTVVTNPTDIQKIQSTGTLEIKIADSKKIEQQLVDFNAGVGLTGFAATTASSTSIFGVSNGNPDVGNFWKLYDVPFDILEGQQIEATMRWPAAVTITTATVITLQLEGYLWGDLVA